MILGEVVRKLGSFSLRCVDECRSSRDLRRVSKVKFW